MRAHVLCAGPSFCACVRAFSLTCLCVPRHLPVSSEEPECFVKRVKERRATAWLLG